MELSGKSKGQLNLHLLEKLRPLVVMRPVPSRWLYLPFLLVMGCLAMGALGEGYPGGGDYLALSLIFLVQTYRPTVLGWWAAEAGWFSVCFVEFLYARIAHHTPGFTPAFLLVWGVLPLVLLWLIRPRAKSGQPGSAPS